METKDKNSNSKLTPYRKPEAQKPGFRMGQSKPVGLAAAQARAAATPLAKKEEFKPIDMAQATNKLGVAFDDSGSMSGQPIIDAHAGFEEFAKNCNPTNTALSVYPFSSHEHYNPSQKDIPLTTDLISVVKAVKQFDAISGTPLYQTVRDMLRNEALTRGIVFSDGAPMNSPEAKEEMFQMAKDKKIAIDSVFIGSETDTGAIKVMQEIAERTGGIFIHFKPGQGNFRQQFKYLSPGLRGMLMDKSFKEKVERGEV